MTDRGSYKGIRDTIFSQFKERYEFNEILKFSYVRLLLLFSDRTNPSLVCVYGFPAVRRLAHRYTAFQKVSTLNLIIITTGGLNGIR